VNGEGKPGNSNPNLETEVNNESLNKEFVCASVKEMEEPLLSRI